MTHVWLVIGDALTFVGAVMAFVDAWRAISWQESLADQMLIAMRGVKSLGRQVLTIPVSSTVPSGVEHLSAAALGQLSVEDAAARFDDLEQLVVQLKTRVDQIEQVFETLGDDIESMLKTVRHPTLLTLAGAIIAIAGLAILAINA